MTPSGTAHETFRLVAQCLNKLLYHMPPFPALLTEEIKYCPYSLFFAELEKIWYKRCSPKFTA
jgi:hypothetical protein